MKCSQCGINYSLSGHTTSLCIDCLGENEDNKEKMEMLIKEGHSYHCAKRIIYGDGECECHKNNMIIGVAIIHEGKIHRMPKPYRHIDLIIYLRENSNDKGAGIKGTPFQGFYIDDKDKTYLTREQAMKLAKENGQLTKDVINKFALFSEDLW